MSRLTRSRWAAALALTIALAPPAASAQEADTLAISGTFNMDGLYGPVGPDLAGVYANDNQHTWTLTLYGATYSYEYYFDEWIDEWGYYGSEERWTTRVYATSFDFEFFGPDADVLNQVVSQRLVGGSVADGAFLEMWYGYGFDARDPLGGGYAAGWDLGLVPSFFEDVWFHCYGAHGFPTDEFGFPAAVPQLLWTDETSITDFRTGAYSVLASHRDVVNVGSYVPPPPPPPPLPPPPTLSIADGSVREGNKGTTRLDLTVMLSRSISDAVTVNYVTANGTAQKKSDYTATSGTLTFQPGQTSRTISIAVKVDRKREANETFTVQLSNAVGATIADAVATATIVNDD